MKAWDEIFALDFTEDYDVKDGVVENFRKDIDYYFDTYAGGDEETREFTKYISLYLALIAKRPLHPLETIRLQTWYSCKMMNTNASPE